MYLQSYGVRSEQPPLKWLLCILRLTLSHNITRVTGEMSNTSSGTQTTDLEVQVNLQMR